MYCGIHILWVILFVMLAPLGVKSCPTLADSLPVKSELPFKIRQKYADALQKAGNYYEAIDVYQTLLNERKEHHYALYQIAECYAKARDYAAAARYYDRVIQEGAEQAFPLTYYRYATMLKMLGDYQAARYAFAKFTLRATGDYASRARREIAACDFAISQMEKPGKFTVAHLDSGVINSPYSEYSPAFFDGKLYYSSFQPNSQGSDVPPLSRLYVSTKNPDNYGKGKPLPPPINSEQFHSGNCSFSPDGKRMYFTQCIDKGEANIRCWIVMLNWADSAWTAPVKLSWQTDNKYTYTHPAVAFGDSTTDIVYFASDMPGGRGGMDLWYTEVKFDGTATTPTNLGQAINTIDNEVTPFYYRGRLYFSSDGHPGMGGLDIFSSSGMKAGWTNPVNLGYPLNSSADDFYFTLGETPRSYFFVSNRPGIVGLRSPTCCDDIFVALDAESGKVTLRGKISEQDDSLLQPLAGCRVELFNVIKETYLKKEEKVLPAENQFVFELQSDNVYAIKVQKKGYFPETLVINLDSITEPEFFKEFILMPIEKSKVYQLENIYYEPNKADLNEEARKTLKSLYELLIENPRLIVEIRSHTDSVGDAKYNMQLSQQRAENCVDYLISLGIEKSRLIPKGFGEDAPLAPNSFPDGTDNPEGRKKNRRTEFKIIGELSRSGEQILY
ncbi:MAG: cell envelope biogenesis protein OmpA [Chitinophagales bacterium]|nr:MAG: cell envelope biogenesis protein OmpA [Chitinophagales bacterium]